jgi:Domain of unknown function (DUF4214)/FG-GAP-like repeat/RTX calcium-binding nonapeptide repeat (4 copies)
MDYHGTDGDDVLDQQKLGLPNTSVIYGGKGNDTITVGNGTAVGQEGNDLITGTSQWSQVAYWSPSAVVVNLATGIAEDGYGTVDTLVNIHTVQGTSFDDRFIGSAGNDVFWGLGGSNSYFGGGGNDTVVFWNTKYEDCKISYNAPTDTFTVIKRTSWGDNGIDTLTGIQTLHFYGPNNYDFQLTKYDLGIFHKISAIPISLANGAGVTAVKVGDFNGDGNEDIIIVEQVGSGTADAPTQILLGNGKSSLVESSSTVFGGSAPMLNPGGGRTLIGDFNNDGMSDIFQLEFGNDAPPFPGGKNALFLSSLSSKTLANATSTLTQDSEGNHGGSVGDVNGDGYLDVLVNTLSHGNKLLINDGTGHFTDRSDLLPHPTVILYGASTLQSNTYSGIVDVNGDRHPDIILGKWDSDSSTPTSQVLLNDGSGNFSKSIPIPLPTSGVYKEIVLDIKPIDLNGDSLPDLALSITSGGEANTVTGVVSSTYYRTPYIQLLVNDGGGKFHDETAVRLPQALVGDSNWFYSLTVTDLNHDGFSDLVATSAGTIPSIVYLNRGNGTFQDAWESVPGGKTVAADVNSDGMTDLITYDNGSISINQNTLPNGHIYKANFDGDHVVASSGNDVLISSIGDDILDGSSGIDTAKYDEKIINFTIKKLNGEIITYTVKDKNGKYGNDTFTNVEALKFSDKTINLTIQSQASAIPVADVTRLSELYVAFFNRIPDADGLSYWISQKASGQTINQIADTFYEAGVQYSSLTGFTSAMSNADFINVVYRNVLGRKDGADAEGLMYWTGKLASGSATRGSLVSSILDSAHTFKGDATYGSVADLLDNKIKVAKTFAVDWGLNYNTPSESIINGMAIAAAITPSSTAAAINLIGINSADLNLG